MMEQKRVLLITRYFPPLDSIATIRMYSWAKYLQRSGWDVSVLTTSKEKQTVVPLELDTSQFKVTEVPYFDPITFFGIDKKKAMQGQECPNTTPSKPSLIKNFFISFYRERMNERIPGRTDPWIIPAINTLKEQKKQGISFDYIISSYGPPSAHVVGHFAAKLFNAYWIADYRDLWLENHIYLGLWPFTKIEKHLEKSLLQQANIITTVSQPLKEVLSKKFSPIPVFVIENGFDPELSDNASDNYFAHLDNKFRIVYTGSLYRGKRDPSPLFQAAQELINEKKIDPNKIEILFYGCNTGDLIDLIKKYKLSHVAHYHGNVGLTDAYSIQKSANLLLFLGDATPSGDGILTGKIFEYLYAKPPILAIGINKESAPGELIEKTMSGVVCGSNIEDIKSTLLHFIENRYSKIKDLNEIMQYTRKRQVENLIHLMR